VVMEATAILTNLVVILVVIVPLGGA